ncbi:hypothetical protein BJV78DRAFT_1287355 [Lactifluus subvellereus]|nr:hypothetical protein BJV78DRAFT_1287355 [Lactifluus subvellereus]
MSHRNVATRPRNATVHPGLIDAPLKRTHGEKTKKEQAEEKKKQKVEKREAAATISQPSRGLQCTRGYLQIPLMKEISDNEGGEGDDGEDNTKLTASIDTETSEPEPPRKKVKAAKVSLRDSVKLQIEKDRHNHGENQSDDEMDIDAVPLVAKLRDVARSCRLTAISKSDDDDNCEDKQEVTAPKDMKVHSKQNTMVTSTPIKELVRLKRWPSARLVRWFDHTMLFYHSLRDVAVSKDAHMALVKDWVTKVPVPPTATVSNAQDTSTPPLTNSGSSHNSHSVTSHSALTNQVKISQGDDIVNSEGAVSDRDETKGPEYEAAISSPPKGKRRVTSSALVKLEDSPRPVAKALRSKKPTNNRLPKEWLKDGTWHKRVVPTLIRWASIQPNPWVIPDVKITDALEKICNAYFGGSELSITTTSVAFRLALQCLSDSWCSVIGSSAIAIINAFFDDHNNYRDDDAMQQEFAQHSLKLFRFTYRKAKGNDRWKFKGAFGGPLIIQTFAAHFDAIRGSKWIHGLYEGEKAPNPRPALTLATTGVERALTLVAHGAITIQGIREAKAKKKALKLPATIHLNGSRDSTRNVAFGYVGWGDQTAKYLFSINNSVSDADMEDIMAEAKELSKAGICDVDQSAAEGVIDLDDDRANIGEGSGTSEDESGEDNYMPVDSESEMV